MAGKYPTKPEIIERLDLPALIQELILSCKWVGKELSGLCPFHEDKNASMSINPKTSVYKCHACGAKGSFFDL
jgi:DNA primase